MKSSRTLFFVGRVTNSIALIVSEKIFSESAFSLSISCLFVSLSYEIRIANFLSGEISRIFSAGEDSWALISWLKANNQQRQPKITELFIPQGCRIPAWVVNFVLIKILP